LPEREAIATINSGLNSGSLNPRLLADQPLQHIKRERRSLPVGNSPLWGLESVMQWGDYQAPLYLHLSPPDAALQNSFLDRPAALAAEDYQSYAALLAPFANLYLFPHPQADDLSYLLPRLTRLPSLDVWLEKVLSQ
jgi:hypothetical protein